MFHKYKPERSSNLLKFEFPTSSTKQNWFKYKKQFQSSSKINTQLKLSLKFPSKSKNLKFRLSNSPNTEINLLLSPIPLKNWLKLN